MFKKSHYSGYDGHHSKAISFILRTNEGEEVLPIASDGEDLYKYTIEETDTYLIEVTTSDSWKIEIF